MVIQKLTKTYDGKAVVDSVSFEIPKGKVLSPVSYTHLDVYKRQPQNRTAVPLSPSQTDGFHKRAGRSVLPFHP